MITQATIDQIFLVARIEEVIGEFVTLRKRGANFIGLCPFHEEKTPSFNISPSKEIYKCFGCGKAGNVIRFLMDHERFTYPEALRYLANKYQIPIEETKESTESLQEKDEISSIYIILNFAQNFYHNYLLTSEEGKSLGLEYFKNRGIKEETILKFQLGFSPSARDILYKEAIKLGYKEEQLFASGLIIKKEDGGYFDRFRERIMFPIHSPAGRTLGFGARTLKSNSNEAKYINSPETKVYSKSNVLYGLFQAKEVIRKKEICYLVEGYLDLISLHQSGIENVVASLGTSLTDNHTKLVKRYSNNLTFIFDGDEAGIKASLRGIDIALKEDLNVKVVALPQGEDPDSFAKKNPREIVHSFIEENTKDFIIYKSDFLYKEKPNDPIHKYEVIKSIVQSLSYIKNRINRSVYIKDLSRILNVDEEILYAELNTQIINNRKKESPTYSREIAQSNIKTQSQTTHNILSSYSSEENEKQILKVLLLYGNQIYSGEQTIANYISYKLSENEWENNLYEKIYNYYIEYLNTNKTSPSIDIFKRHPDLSFQDIAIEFEDILQENISPNWKKKLGKDIIKPELIKEINYIMNHFTLRKYQIMKKQNLLNLKTTNITEEQKVNFQILDKHITDMINKIAHELNIVITK